MEHDNLQYFSEGNKRKQILPLLVQFPEQNSTALLLYREPKTKSNIDDNSDEQKMAMNLTEYTYLQFSFSFVFCIDTVSSKSWYSTYDSYSLFYIFDAQSYPVSRQPLRMNML